MKQQMEQYLGFDSYYIIFGIIGILLLLIVMLFILLISTKKKLGQLTKNYEEFMKGKNAESMEDAILDKFKEIDWLKEADKKKQDSIDKIFEKLKETYQKLGIVKYDAFQEMGGKLSFSLAILDEENNGYVMNSMHSREGCYTYIKEIEKGQSNILLADEEKQALEQAMNK